MSYNANIKELKDALTNHAKVLVFFYSDWCGESKMMDVVFSKVSLLKNFSEIKFLKIDVDDQWLWKGEKNSDVYEILKTPTLISFLNNKEAERITNFRPREDVFEFTTRLLKK